MNRALLIHAGALGDFVMALRVVAAIRQGGADHVTVLGRPHIARLAGPDGGVDAVIDIEIGGWHALFSQEAALPPHLAARLRTFDIAVNMLAGSGSPVRSRLIEAGVHRVIDIDPRPKPDWPGHVSDQWLADLRAAGIRSTIGPPRIRCDDAARYDARRRLDAETQSPVMPIAILHPGSGSRRKCWPVGNFVELAGAVLATGRRAVFLLGPAETERSCDRDVARLRATTTTIAGRPLHEAAALITASDLFVGNDSGPSHLAAALGVHTVAVFGTTDPDTWRPLGPHVTVVRSPAPGAWPSVSDVRQALPRPQ